jgi:hypothetical protein
MRYPSRTHDDRIDRRDALRTALIVSALFWGLLVYGSNFDDALPAKLRGILGEEPDGLRFDLYILLFAFQLAAPMIFFLYHTLITLTYAKRYQASMAHAGDIGAAVGLIDYLRYLVKGTGEGPVIRRSKLIVFAGILYLLGMFSWWIYWTDKHGI